MTITTDDLKKLLEQAEAEMEGKFDEGKEYGMRLHEHLKPFFEDNPPSSPLVLTIAMLMHACGWMACMPQVPGRTPTDALAELARGVAQRHNLDRFVEMSDEANCDCPECLAQKAERLADVN
jgi:hypothetical protein